MPLPLAALATPLLMELAKNGLGLIAGAIQAKGKELVEEKLGVKIPDEASKLTPELLQQLQVRQMEHEESLTKMAMEAEQHAQAQVTERWKFDMSSDSWLSKNVRPLVLAWVFANITMMMLMEAFKIDFSIGLVGLIETISSIVVGAYFVGRTAEKGVSIWRKK